MNNKDLTKEQLIDKIGALQDKINSLEKTVAAQSQAEDALRASEKNLAAILENNADGIVIVDADGDVLYVNPAAEKLFGKSKEDFIGYPFGFPVSADKAEDYLVIRQGDLLSEVELRVVQVHWQNRPAFELSVRDITERKQKDEDLQKLNRTLQAKSKSSHAMMRTTDERLYLNEVCHIIAEDCGHALVWIGYAQDDAEKTVRPVAHAGFQDGYLESLKVTWKDMDRGRGPVGKAIRTGKVSIFRRTANDPAFAPWRKEALKRGYAAVIAIPLLAAGKAFGSLNIYSREEDPFSDDEVRLLSDLAADLSYGITAIRLRAAQADKEAAIRKSEQRFRSLFENMIEGFAYCKMIFENEGPCDFIYLEVNDAFEKLTGLKNVVGKKVSEVIPGIRESLPELFEIYGRVALSGKPEKFEVFSESFGGWLSISSYSTKREYFIAVIDNITEQKQADMALRASEDKYCTLIEDMNEGVFVMDDQGTFTFVNNALALIHGYEKSDDLIGKNFSELIPAENREALKQEFRRNMQNGTEPGLIDVSIERPDQSKGYIQVHPMLIIEDGRMMGMQGIVRDITEHKLSETYIRILSIAVEQSPSCIIITDTKGTIEYVNPKFVEVTGYTAEETLGQNPRILKSGNKAVEEYKRLWETLLSGSEWRGEFYNKKKNGDFFWESSSISPIRDETGRITHFIAIKEDITKRKKMELKLQEYTENLELIVEERTKTVEDSNCELQLLNQELTLRRREADAATKAKSDFLANMSHELRTPLNSIIGFSELFRDGIIGELTGEQLEAIEYIHSSGEHLTSLINDILDLSKVEAGKLELEVNEFSLRELLSASKVMLMEKAMKHNIKFNLKIEPEADILIEADERKLKQIMYNLLSNALKFTPDEGSVSVSARMISDAGAAHCGCPGAGEYPDLLLQDFIEISVTDTGIGIKDEELDRLFQPFSQLESAYTKKYEGTGLGLALTKKLIELHGGKIWVESEYGKWSRFAFAIPVKQEDRKGVS